MFAASFSPENFLFSQIERISSAADVTLGREHEVIRRNGSGGGGRQRRKARAICIALAESNLEHAQLIGVLAN